MKISKMAKSITPSLTRKLFNMANQKDNVINLTLGDPDILPPEKIRSAGCDAISAGKTRYSANAGLIEARKAYGSFCERKYNINVDPDTQIIATVGGMEALFLSLTSIVDQSDEVIILGPYYVNYLQMINMIGATPVIIDILNKSDENIVDDIRKKITKKTVALIINTPCNPTGQIFSAKLTDEISKLAVKHDLYVISDEVYSSLIYDDNKFESVITRPQMQERTILIDSCSKRFAMTGWRIGFAVANENVISNMTKMQENVAACAPLVSQYAAIKAYKEDFDYSYIKDEYQQRRNIVVNAIDSISQLSCITPKATFYCFVNISKTGLNSEEFAYKLLEQKHVAVVPGVAYGKEYNDYVRIAFTLKREVLKEAMKRIKDFCEEC